MATEVYQPPQELPVTTRVYRLETDTTGTSLYADPDMGPIYMVQVQVVGNKPTIAVTT